ncbi:ABC transporter ATP-binding protein [Dysgonomonas sp. 25]|uniref:ABC transporter ATP-binding protein n=1 Tax=Dysgonomonas sp. 25 TaxID=2302933 RepID=UPI00162AA10E|nr:ABC transporter ATP-binding protein [Dysgonomonas sp. 25]
MNREVIISAENIAIGYHKTKQHDTNCLYSDLSFELYKGELVCLLGANGAGKSTLLRTISASQPVLSGEISLEGKSIQSYKEKDLSKRMGLVLTDKTSAGGLTVRELVELGRYPYTGFFGQLDEQDKAIVNQAIKDVGIAHKKEAYIAELSDGERQKAMIAKSLAQECPIILLDEPTAFLDITSSIEIISLLHQLAINQQKTILLSTHNVDLALHLADRLWLLSREKGLQCGVTEDIVLSGAMDNFFDSENIVFNDESGVFLPKVTGTKKAFIQADTPLLHYWTKNLLARYNIQMSDKEDDTALKIAVHSPTLIRLSSDNETVEINSFEQLAEWLRKNN